ncbi:MAG: thioredoxin [Firmicutes bacterium]|nr:thioredoxin [Bacillota bacterium]
MTIKSLEEFKNAVSNEYVLVDFYADWCGPCKMLSPIIENIASSRDNIKVYKVNVDELGDVAREYAVMSIPTLILFKNGNMIDKKIGFNPESVLNDWINENR